MKIENALYHLLRPIGDAAYYFAHHPLNALSDALYATGDFIQENPYTCAVVLGLGMYAAHKGMLRFHHRRMDVNVDIDTCLFGYRTNTTFRLGGR
jgi:hypothetical protein